MKKILKKAGKTFINLTFRDPAMLRQSVLIVDNCYSWIGQLNLAIERIKDYFPKAEISVLTCAERKAILEKDFSELKFILTSKKTGVNRYQIALKMLKMRRENYDFITLISLDISPIVIALIFLKTKVILCNQWGQWWSLRLRKLTEIFKVNYTKRKARSGLKTLLKKIGLFFILVQQQDEELIKHSTLVIDNAYVSFGHIITGIERIKESLPDVDILLLTTAQREGLKDRFGDLKISQTGSGVFTQLRIVQHMLALRKNKYDYIVLLSLDIIPIAISILFMRGKVVLFNRLHQWWSLKPRAIRSYFKIVPLVILNIVIFVYLAISVSWIFLKRAFNVFRFSFLRKGA